MTTPTYRFDQIAAEANSKLHRGGRDLDEANIAIIKSAIEIAYDAGWDSSYKASRAAHPIEPTDQIASEAANDVMSAMSRHSKGNLTFRERTSAIIKSAIHKAMSGQRIYGEWGTAVVIPDEAAQPKPATEREPCGFEKREPFAHDAKTN